MPLREKLKRVFSRPSSSSSKATAHPSLSSCAAAAAVSPSPLSSAQSRPQAPVSKTSRKPAKQKPTTVILAGVKAVKVKPRTDKNGNPIIELYKPHEIPRSKYRGPFDEEHLKALARYSIPAAMAGRSRSRPRSMVSELSPGGTWAPPSPERRDSGVLGGQGPMRMSMIEGLERALEKMEESGSLKVEGGRRPSLVNTRWNNDQNDDNDDDNDNDTESIMYLPDTSDNVSSSTLLTLHTFYTGDTKTTAPSCTCGDRDDGSSKTNEFSR